VVRESGLIFALALRQVNFESASGPNTKTGNTLLFAVALPWLTLPTIAKTNNLQNKLPNYSAKTACQARKPHKPNKTNKIYIAKEFYSTRYT
jgi:hypothetical protein